MQEGGENEASLRFPIISSNLFRVMNSFNRAGPPSCMLISLVDFFPLNFPGHNVVRSHAHVTTTNSPNDNGLFKKLIFPLSQHSLSTV